MGCESAFGVPQRRIAASVKMSANQYIVPPTEPSGLRRPERGIELAPAPEVVTAVDGGLVTRGELDFQPEAMGLKRKPLRALDPLDRG